jgi:hypothetical protein
MTIMGGKYKELGKLLNYHNTRLDKPTIWSEYLVLKPVKYKVWTE